MITLGKQGTLAARRRALTFVQSRAVVKKLFDDIAPRFKDRPGGYTRIIKLGIRHGDAAPVSLIELVERAGARAPRRRARRSRSAAARSAAKGKAKAARARGAARGGLPRVDSAWNAA